MSTQNRKIHIGNCPRKDTSAAVKGEYIPLLGESYYCIHNYDHMPPFFMNIVSSSDQWMFISSSGGLTAGRVNADSALFPYYTHDKITESASDTGHKAVFLVTAPDGTTQLWEPFSTRYAGIWKITRNLYKNIYGDKLIFEEINHDLDITYRYAWRTSDRYGFIKTSWLENHAPHTYTIDLIDGLQNILPYGITSRTQNLLSNLLNAYKRNELEPQTGLGMFTLSATMTDLAEPSESLKGTTAWQIGLTDVRYLLSTLQLDAFEQGKEITQETDIRNQHCAYLVNTQFDLEAGQEKEWHIVAEVNQDACQVASLLNELKGDRQTLEENLKGDIEQGTKNLIAIVASTDGLQHTNEHLTTAHHFANALFNAMRGGIFNDNYTITTSDLQDDLQVRNRIVLQDNQSFFSDLPDKITTDALMEKAIAANAMDLERLCCEYLPLTFSRRHGDPSRPWNRFSINIKKADGTRNLDYQGNWRDIFQNWEPLAYAFPEFVEGMICKFVNATTADGYNPYRITRDGIEWEVPEPSNPWANIGYWGDHQVIYLQKLLEISAQVHPGKLHALLERKRFSHANIPYRIKPYEEILSDWYDTIIFDAELDEKINTLVQEMGTDGKLVQINGGDIFHVNLAEKLLVLLLAKLTNFIPEGGIWMNTQRPEWNDANNALVGKGISVVTTCYLRRFIVFLENLITTYNGTQIEITAEVKATFDTTLDILKTYQSNLDTSFDNQQRRAMMDALGETGSTYRWNYYQNGFSNQFTTVKKQDVLDLLDLARQYIEHTLQANRRPDGLYHAYNTLRLGENSAMIDHQYEMLEGQVAILSAGMLSGEQALDLLHSLRESALYREDQHSYILYPDRDLPGFLEKNHLTPEQVKSSKLVKKLAANNDLTLITKDENGIYHFASDFRNAKDVTRALENLKQDPEYTDLVDAESDLILDLFEEEFDHASFTGRSGTFFAYEGLGSIYWHMVSKLLLATQENVLHAYQQGDKHTAEQLADIYYDIRSGIGFNKSPDVYGAFPTDPYSHTPADQGAKQPGMTGQVKEELLTRLAELGVFIDNGTITFDPKLLRSQELIARTASFEYIDVHGQPQSLALPTGALAYTLCQVPVVYVASDETHIEITDTEGQVHQAPGNSLDAETSLHIFCRDGHVKQITVYTQPGR